MATFQYEAVNTKSGKTESGEMPAASQAEALARLQEMGLAPTKVEQAKVAKKKTKGKKGKKSGHPQAPGGASPGEVTLQPTPSLQ